MTYQSTDIAIIYRTSSDPRKLATFALLEETVPMWLLNAVVVSFLVSMMTASWLVGCGRVAVVNGLFIVAMAAVMGCAAVAMVRGVCVTKRI